MMQIIYRYALLFMIAFGCNLPTSANAFYWGVSSSAYQTEGAYNVDGKGLSNWDYLTHLGITKYHNGGVYNADTAVDGFHKMKDDVALLKKLGVTSYRFSVAWSRVLPDGVTVNQKGVNYYKDLVTELNKNGIRPLITIYHWDMPISLYENGGEGGGNFITYYRRYANLLFDSFGDSVDFITFNEPVGEVFELNPMVKAFSQGNSKLAMETFTSEKIKANQARVAHNVLLAHAYAVNDFHHKKTHGMIGIALNLSPSIPNNPQNYQDVAAAKLNDELRNQWFLNPIFLGNYPSKAAGYFQKLGWEYPSKSDLIFIKNNQPDFIGINYYSPMFVSYDSQKAFGISVLPNSDKHKSYNGPVRPDSLYDLLVWVDRLYKHPKIIITEVGAGFGEADEAVNDGKITDNLRANFIIAHAKAALKAKAAGVDLQGFYVWSLVDNFEWMCAYECRFGLVHISYEDKSFKRTPKKSFDEYRRFILANLLK